MPDKRAKTSGKRRRKYRFAVALSFPGQHREYVRRVDAELCKLLKPEQVFFDERFEAELLGFRRDIYLQEIYHDRSELIVVFLCKEYARSEWCGLEWDGVRDLIKKRRGVQWHNLSQSYPAP